MPTKILIIQASRTEALRTRLILEREGHQVRLAADGKEGLFQAAQDKPDLILLDTIMPQVSGFETCARLKLDPKTNTIPVVMLTSNGEEADMPSGPGLGCFLHKPYDPAKLIAQVKVKSNGHANSSAEAAADPRELQRLRQALEAANKTRTDLLANMSHELRTPLHELIGMTDLLLGTELTSEQQNYIKTAQASSNALLSLISDVIEFSEMEAGQLGLEEKAFELSDPLARVAEIMAPRAADKGIEFLQKISPNVPRSLLGDPNRLRQVLTNLAANACKFTERGQVSILVDVEAIRSNEVELHFRVDDTGIGIPASRREIIFEPFQQADISATRRHTGMGMGLALARRLVTLMGGRIWVESVPGQGSSFHFIVKLKPQVQAAHVASPAAAGPKADLRHLYILVAEDSPTNQLIARSSLGKAGHKVALAVNGLEAVKAFEAARTEQFDLILMDVSMPELDGLEATRLIREKEQTLGGHIPIVAMTAFATKEYQIECRESGMDAYVTKPIRIDDLKLVIEPLLASAAKSPPPLALPPPVDLKEALEVVGDDVDILREASAIALEEVPEQLDKLKQAAAQKDAHGVQAFAHRLKGVMGNLGGMQARAIGQRLETLGEQGDVSGAPDIVFAFEREINRVVAFYSDSSWEGDAREQIGEGNG